METFLTAEETGIVAARSRADQPDRPAECRIRMTVPVKIPENPGIPDLSRASRQGLLITTVLPVAARERITDLCRSLKTNGRDRFGGPFSLEMRLTEKRGSAIFSIVF